MAKESIAAGTIITWSKATGEFGAILMVAGATRMKTETLPIAVFLNLSTGDINMAIAAATILIIISVVSYAVFDRIFKPAYGM
jgi:molybdate transport system permease protein